jgi:hypothetical protein
VTLQFLSFRELTHRISKQICRQIAMYLLLSVGVVRMPLARTSRTISIGRNIDIRRLRNSGTRRSVSTRGLSVFSMAVGLRSIINEAGQLVSKLVELLGMEQPTTTCR